MATSTPTANSQSDDPKLQKPQFVSQHANNIPGSGGAKHEGYLPKGISETEEEMQNHWFIGSIDQGTTSSRFLIFNGEGNPIAGHQIEFENTYPEPGSVFDGFLLTTSVAFANRNFLDGMSMTPSNSSLQWKNAWRRPQRNS